MAKGRQPGVIVFGFKSFLEGVVREAEGLKLSDAPNETQKKKIEAKVSDLREALKAEKGEALHITAKDAPNTVKVLNLFTKELRESLKDREASVGLRIAKDLAEKRAAEAEARIAELEAQLARATRKKAS